MCNLTHLQDGNTKVKFMKVGSGTPDPEKNHSGSTTLLLLYKKIFKSLRLYKIQPNKQFFFYFTTQVFDPYNLAKNAKDPMRITYVCVL
jgi:hypothetical protein